MQKLTAHYYASKAIKFVVFGVNGVHADSHQVAVTGKKHAQSLAKKYNAQPWNF